MAMYDWNHDGKKDGIDDYLEYQIIHKDHASGSNRASHNAKSTGISTFGAVFSVVSGFVLAALLYTVCDIDVKDVPVVITILLWVVFLALMAEFAEKIGL